MKANHATGAAESAAGKRAIEPMRCRLSIPAGRVGDAAGAARPRRPAGTSTGGRAPVAGRAFRGLRGALAVLVPTLCLAVASPATTAAATWEYRSEPTQKSRLSSSVWVPDRSPFRKLRGVFFIFLRDPYSVDLYLDPDWRTFWSDQGFAVVLMGAGGNPGVVGRVQVSYGGTSMVLQDAYLRIVADAGAALGHPELGKAPIIWWGHSATTFTESAMVKAFPERSLAFVSYHGFDYFESLNAAAREVPGIVTAGRLDKSASWKDRYYADGTYLPGTYTHFQSARRAGSPYTGGLDIDSGHGSGLYPGTAGDTVRTENADPPLRTDPVHYRHRGNAYVHPAIPAGPRDAWQLENFLGRKSFLMPALEQVIGRRLPSGTFDPETNPLRSIDQRGDWLVQLPPPSPALFTAEEPPFGDFGIKSWAAASVTERTSWAWVPTERLARLWQFYFSGGYTGPRSPSGVEIRTLASSARVGGSTGVLELRRPGADAWRLDSGLGTRAYANNHTNTERWCTVAIQPSSTAVMGTDYVIDRSAFVSRNLAGRVNDGYGTANTYAPTVPAIPKWYQAPGAVRFFDRTSTSYITVRALANRYRVSDRTVDVRVTGCDGLGVGAVSTATVVVKRNG